MSAKTVRQALADRPLLLSFRMLECGTSVGRSESSSQSLDRECTEKESRHRELVLSRFLIKKTRQFGMPLQGRRRW